MSDGLRGRKRVAPGITDAGDVADVAPASHSAEAIAQGVADATLTPPITSSSLIDQLIGQYAPPQDTVRFFAGVWMEFRALTDRAAMNRIRERAIAFARKPTGGMELETRALYNTDADTLTKAYVLSELSISPKFSPEDLLKAAKRAALLFEGIWGGWSHAQANAANVEDARILDMATERIRSDVMWRNRLMIARDVYGKHPLELEGGSYEDIQLLDFVALAILEQDEVKRA